ncbi:MAG: bifunctional lysine ketoglutarate reductase /saccharopine dehydrogenase family protein [Thermoanaerobaculales bacterium]|jgi:alpha-aminoadipic semialdehyde synthase|nr:bifunctional lysine ketoglutarate reductase /saccharopine dehydrogenase family protein [Thermoanaerobaculales bacterium]
MRPSIGIRRETKSPWERRSPVTPALARHLIKDNGMTVFVQPSARRIFPDADYTRAGATLTTSLDDANIILGVKEVPPELLNRNSTYLFFSHVIKGQPTNMPMLRRIMDLGCTLIDYEKIADDQGRRLVFFGRFAGLAGMIDSLWALGQRLQEEGIRTALRELSPSHQYEDLEAAKAAVRAAGERIADDGLPDGLPPLVIGIAGYGNVAKGAREILAELPTREVTPAELLELKKPSAHCMYQVTFTEGDVVRPVEAGHAFELQDYYDHPERYESDFARFLPHLSLLMNCNYWEERYPRLVTTAEIRSLYRAPEAPRLKVIGDLGCDVDGSIQCTLKCTEPGDPVYVYDVDSDDIARGFSGRGPTILAVDILPTELPLEASEEFAKALASILPSLGNADFGAPFEDLDIPPEIARAVIVHRGELTPDFQYLEAHLNTGE